MPIGEINLPALMQAFPYVAPIGAGLKQKAEEEKQDIKDFISWLEKSSGDIPTDIKQLLTGSPKSSVVGTDEWQTSSLADLDGIKKLTEGLGKALDKLDVVVSALEKILKIISLFISGFNSFSKLIVSAIDLAQNKLNEYTDTSLKTGVYANVLVPPAFLQGSETVAEQQLQARGGFDGFLTRLETSLKNSQDVNRPVFSLQDYVGGLVIIADSESLDAIWEALKQLSQFFDFLKLFKLNLAPPAPTNLKGFTGFFTDPEGAKDEEEKEVDKFGVQLEWNKNYTAPASLVYRSRIPGGETQIVEYRPTSLVDDPETGEAGLLRYSLRALRNIKRKDPILTLEKEEQVYADPDFNGGEPVLVDAVRGGVTVKYVDTFIKTKKQVIDGKTYEIPYYINDEGEEVRVLNYYYVIKSCTSNGRIKGADSKELVVAVKTCNDNFDIADLIPQANGQVEFFSGGMGKINSWSSIQIGGMIPWFTELVGILNNFLDSLRGMATDASDSFSDFLKQIKSKITMYIQILDLITFIVEQISGFLLGASIAFLNLGPVKGGTKTFVDRVRGAQPPEGESFSGPSGTTIGIVLMYGSSITNLPLLLPLKKTFDFIYKLFVKD